ncbi:Wzz/FepE/Etk N-terminal domain-containing protein [Shinella sp. CPCC 101442]|uniref:Wzz/FepE/Etk N-terminal domain-containing protein n=1 Tax=Shinella sp. CPCC 101442 TaxID=2932265 RepID=UPI0021529E87|nr:Wzz/FepE/Etk N-terminal domain-containing protein [Shinella sp. CPCC 101442]MCR6502406.1 Wzz/FepE/Etk N-terminal domain-containing protein [Shinella sp. CPCC 101442]
MHNLDFGFYLSIARRRLPLVLLVTLVALLAAVLVTKFRKPVYTASAKLLVEAPQIPAELARSTVPMGATAQLLILQQEITTHDALVALASSLDIYAASPETPPDEDIVADMRSRIGFRQLQLDAQDPAQRVAIYAVSFDAGTPALAAKVTNELVALVLSKNQRERTSRASNTLEFFDQKAVALNDTLKQLEADILQFKKDNRESLPESIDFYRSELLSQHDRLASLEREASELRSKRGALVAAYTNTDQLPGIEQRLTPDQQLLVDLNKALSEQLTVFSDDSPNIAAIRTRIAELEKRILAVRSPVVTDGKAQNVRSAPFGLDLQLSEIDQRLEAIASEKATSDKRIAALRQSIARAPISEAGLTALQRNRDNVQKQYNAAVVQRAEASTGEQLEIRSDGERFSLLEAAVIPTKAAGPGRRLIVAGGALAGLGLGLGLVVLLELLNRTVRRPRDITNLLEVEPLATIPVIGMSNPRKRWKRLFSSPAQSTSAWGENWRRTYLAIRRA